MSILSPNSPETALFNGYPLLDVESSFFRSFCSSPQEQVVDEAKKKDINFTNLSLRL